MISAWKRLYGESPLHLLGQIIAFAVAVYAYLQIIEVTSTDNLNLLIWFVAGALLHDMIFLPVYLVLDLIARLGLQDHALRHVRAINHVRVPAVISGVMLLTLFPLICGQSEANYVRLSGDSYPDYAGRWLLLTAALFALSAIAYAVRLRVEATRSGRAAAVSAGT